MPQKRSVRKRQSIDRQPDFEQIRRREVDKYAIQISFLSRQASGELSLGELMRWGAAVGFDGISIATPIHLDPEEVKKQGPGRVLDLAEASGLQVTDLAPMVSLLAADSATEKEHMAVFRRNVEAAASLGVAVVKMVARPEKGMYFRGMPGRPPDTQAEGVVEAVKRFRKLYGEAVRFAEDRGVKVALETAPRGSSLASSPQMWDMLFEAVPSSSLGLAFDPSHLVWLMCGPIPPVIRRYSDRIFLVDGKDTEIYPERLQEQGNLGNSWWAYRVPGYGQVKWEDVLSTLYMCGFNYAISIENEDPVYPGLIGMEMALRHLRRIMPPEFPPDHTPPD